LIRSWSNISRWTVFVKVVAVEDIKTVGIIEIVLLIAIKASRTSLSTRLDPWISCIGRTIRGFIRRRINWTIGAAIARSVFTAIAWSILASVGWSILTAVSSNLGSYMRVFERSCNCIYDNSK